VKGRPWHEPGFTVGRLRGYEPGTRGMLLGPQLLRAPAANDHAFSEFDLGTIQRQFVEPLKGIVHPALAVEDLSRPVHDVLVR
jgi:hypothetical protein